ncbi:MAG: pyridoxamine 5'-phosphate oxidase [Janthinobacterium lividum]
MNALIASDFTLSDDPDALFDAWMADAKASEPRDPNAIALATVDADGRPNVRTVLLKGKDEHGFVFYTNAESAKGEELKVKAEAAFVLYWKSLNRQIRVRGSVDIVSEIESDAYFQSRHPRSRLGAIASRQSRPLDSRATLEDDVAKLETLYRDKPIPRPVQWHGFRVVPYEIEFWADRDNRLHDRIVFRRDTVTAPWPTADWSKQRLYP